LRFSHLGSLRQQLERRGRDGVSNNFSIDPDLVRHQITPREARNSAIFNPPVPSSAITRPAALSGGEPTVSTRSRAAFSPTSSGPSPRLDAVHIWISIFFAAMI